jgi:hypothetical protein
MPEESATNVPLTEQFRFEVSLKTYGSRSGIRPGSPAGAGLVGLHSGNGSGVYFELSRQARKIVDSQWFNNSIYVTILVGCILSGLETYQEELGEVGRMATTIGDSIVITIFCIEALLKICSKGRSYFKMTANLFDFAVTLISLVLLLATSTTAINPLVFSLFRLFRCLELVSHSRKLRWICAGFIGGIQSILYIVALMSLVLFVYAITGVFYFGRNDPYNFGTFRAATISLLKVSYLMQHAIPVSLLIDCALSKVTTLDDWRRIFYANFFGCYWSCQAAPMFVYPDKVRCVHSEPHPKTSLLYFGRYGAC